MGFYGAQNASVFRMRKREVATKLYKSIATYWFLDVLLNSSVLPRVCQQTIFCKKKTSRAFSKSPISNNKSIGGNSCVT